MSQQFVFRLHVRGPDLEKEIELKLGATTIGRQPDNDLQLPHEQVSRYHARIDCDGINCRLTDLGSANGIYVNGVKMQPKNTVEIGNGANLQIGRYTLTYSWVAVVAVSDAPALATPRASASAPPPAETRAEPVALVPNRVGPPRPPPLATVLANGREPELPPGVSLESQRLLRYLPGLYHTELMKQFLLGFEAIWTPIEWTVDNFDLFLYAASTPADFLPWLARWFGLAFDATWDEGQRRACLTEAHLLYARRGTRWALSRLLEIYTGHKPEISDDATQPPSTFTVRLPSTIQAKRTLIETLIEANKPAGTLHRLEFVP